MENGESNSAGGGRKLLVITGELDIANRDSIPNLVRDAITSTTAEIGVEIGLDLSGVAFIDCAGLTGILDARELAADRGCQLRLAAVSPAVHRILELTNTTRTLIEQ